MPVEEIAETRPKDAAVWPYEAGRAASVRTAARPYAVVQLRQDNAIDTPVQCRRLSDPSQMGRTEAPASR